MHRTIVISFATLDGIIEDPDGSGGTANGGWAFRHGPEHVAGDKFKLGPILYTGILLLGRKTWEIFSHIWPGRADGFSAAMNQIPKLVATRTVTDVSAWSNSEILDDDLFSAVERHKGQRDVIVAASTSLVRALAEHDLVDEYRILVFPTVLGSGTRLFPEGSPPAQLDLVTAETTGPAVLLRYSRPAR